MAGVHIDLDVIGLDRVARVLQRLLETSHDVDPILRDIGEHLLNSTKDRFATEESPGGRPWKPLKPACAEHKRKKRPNAKKLVWDNLRRGQLAYVVGGGELTLGSNRPYAARQHFGFHGPDSLGRYFDHPARPWLGVSADDEDEIVRIFREHLLASTAG